jgi:thiamine biosynthesis protein ThiC
MNMIKENGSILCRYFIMLKQKTEGDPLFINGPVVVDIKKGTSNMVSAYYT